jgi:hypothetical protein
MELWVKVEQMPERLRQDFPNGFLRDLRYDDIAPALEIGDTRIANPVAQEQHVGPVVLLLGQVYPVFEADRAKDEK